LSQLKGRIPRLVGERELMPALSLFNISLTIAQASASCWWPYRSLHFSRLLTWPIGTIHFMSTRGYAFYVGWALFMQSVPADFSVIPSGR